MGTVFLGLLFNFSHGSYCIGWRRHEPLNNRIARESTKARSKCGNWVSWVYGNTPLGAVPTAIFLASAFANDRISWARAFSLKNFLSRYHLFGARGEDSKPRVVNFHP
jgi:hypothetical protein